MSTAVAVADDANELSCVVIPTPGQQLLLPNVCIAEIMPWRRIKPLQGAPSWCMGLVGWRGRTVPVLNYGGFNDAQAAAPTSARCLVVMNRSRNPSGPAFYAFAAVGLPRMLQLLDDDVETADAKLGVADVMRVQVGTELATIPSLEFVEGRLAELAQSLRKK